MIAAVVAFFTGPLGRWLVILVALAAAASWGAAKMHQRDQVKYEALEKRYAALESRHTGFVAATEAEGKRAEKARIAKEDHDRKTTERINAEHKLARDRDARTIARLRADAAARDSRGGSTGPGPADSGCPPEQVCFDRAEYQRALGEFDSGARRLADEGTKVATDLDAAADWAQNP